MKKDYPKIIFNFLFFAYCAVMLLMLFHRTKFDLGMGYLVNLKNSYNIIPFATVLNYIKNLSHEAVMLRRSAYINLIGNVVCFIPLGFFLPAKLTKARKFPSFLVCTAGIILTVELLQLFRFAEALMLAT